MEPRPISSLTFGLGGVSSLCAAADTLVQFSVYLENLKKAFPDGEMPGQVQDILREFPEEKLHESAETLAAWAHYLLDDMLSR